MLIIINKMNVQQSFATCVFFSVVLSCPILEKDNFIKKYCSVLLNMHTKTIFKFIYFLNKKLQCNRFKIMYLI